VTVLDASAALAFVMGEPGAEVVEPRLRGALLGTANLSEVLARMPGRAEASLAESLLVASGVVIEPVSIADARAAAAMWAERPRLSLSDRLCLALAARLDSDVLTADRAWGTDSGVVQIR
jgi:PIN domain nuclease of toxin-antitoxin system